MQVLKGHSTKPNGREAVAEATEGWNVQTKLDLIIVFNSSAQDPNEVAAAFRERFGDTPFVGCTTAGEHLGDEHFTKALVCMGISSPGIRWAVSGTETLEGFDEETARRLSDDLFGQLGIQREEVNPQRQFCLLFVDGLSGKEELLCPLMADALEGMPLVGGSAGDDLKFERTYLYHGGKAHPSGAVFVLADSKVPFDIIKHQHYTTTTKRLVITKADVPARRVYEMDGVPALQAYAEALGKPISAITDDVTLSNPLTFVCNDEIYVRSVARIESDGSMVFFCAIEEGMVLSLGRHEDMTTALKRDVDGLAQRIKGADLLIGCNCILRALEATKLAKHPSLSKILSDFAENMIGFDTYGEQLNGLHINQTFVGVAIRSAAEVTR